MTVEARTRRTTLELVADSLALARDAWLELTIISVLGVLPGAFLVYAAGFAGGLADDDTLLLVMAGEEPTRLIPLAFAHVLAYALSLLSTLTLLLAADARERGQPLTAVQAWRKALTLAPRFFKATLRLAASTAAWALLFIFPGMLVLMRGAFFAHAVALEGLGGLDAVNRSREIVARAPVYTLGNLFAAAMISAAGAYAAIVFLRVAMITASALAPSAGGALEFEFASLLETALAGAVGAWAAAFSVLLYKDAAAQ